MGGELPVSGSADLHPPKTRLGQEGLRLPDSLKGPPWQGWEAEMSWVGEPGAVTRNLGGSCLIPRPPSWGHTGWKG